MKIRNLFKIVLLSILLACSTVTITGRKQLNIMPAPQILSMSFQQYDQFLKEHKVITGTPEARMVERVGRKIQKAVEHYFAEKGNLTKEQLNQLVHKKQFWFTGREAIKYGYADGLLK